MSGSDANSDIASTETTLHVSRSYSLSAVGLILGILALGLAVVPALAFDRPLPNPFATTEQPKPPKPPEPEGGFTLKYKNFSVNLGGKKRDLEEPHVQPPQPKLTTDPIRLLTIAAIACALVGIVFSTIGQLKEKHTSITAVTMLSCVAAITWQYFAAGIMIGAGIAVFILVIAMLGSALSAA
jgi:hypothetical protein